MAEGGADRERAAIMRAAHRLVGTGGSAAIEDILCVAGVNRRIFYRHFASKEALLVAMVHGAGDAIGSGLCVAVDEAPDADAAVRAWVRRYLEFAWDERQAMAGRTFLAPEVAATAGVADAIEAGHERHRAFLAGVLRRGLADGSFPTTDPDPDAFAIHAVALQHAELQVLGRSRVEFAQAAETVEAMVGRLTGSH